MKKICLVLALTALLTFSAVRAEVEVEEDVLILTDSNFDEELAKHEFLLVEFYAPWCGHCKNLAPEYAKAAKRLKENNPPFSIAKVDVTANEKLGQRFQIQGFPTLKFFRKGEHSEYTGGRTEPDISNWVLKKVGPPSTEVTCEQLKEKIENDKLVLAFFGDATSNEFSNIFLNVAGDSKVGEKFNFYHTTDKACANSHGAKETPALVLFRKFDESPLVYHDDLDVESVVGWLIKSSVPTVIEFSEDYIEPIFGERKDTIVLFRDPADSQADFTKAFEKAASEFKGQVLFVTSGIKDGIQARLAEFIGVEQSSLPTIRLLMPSDNMKKFAYSEDVKSLTVDGVKKFIQDFKDGKLSPFLKSEEPPTDNSEPVKIVVGKTYKDLVLDNTKDVLLEVYAPWCGHCKSLAPTYEQLASDLKDVSNLVIAKLDGTANEVEGLEIQGFPTLKFFPAGNKSSPVEYSAGRELDDFKNWLKENSEVYKKHLAAKEPKTEEL